MVTGALRAAGINWLSQDCQLCAVRTSEPLCESCRDSLPAMNGACCARCGQLAPDAWLCGACIAHPPAFDATLAAFRYAYPLDRLIQSLKFRSSLWLVPMLGGALAHAIRRSTLRPDILVPVPLSRRRLAERGFNQSALIAVAVSRELAVPVELGCLRKVRDTAAQAGLDRRARRSNVRGAFACMQLVAGRHVALVDDVMTTGATLDEVAVTLKRAGALTVTACVVARADRNSDDNAGAIGPG